MIQPIPKVALPVVEILREEVPRPKSLPTSRNVGSLRWNRGWVVYCPMGLHKKSSSSQPLYPEDFCGGRLDHDAVYSFGYWWDGIAPEDAERAMDLIWPPRKRA